MSRLDSSQGSGIFRKDLVELLLNRPMRLYEIAKPLDLKVREIESHLRHLAKTLKHSEYELVVHPAVCHKCSFAFSPEHLRKPGKCPRCKGTWIAEPLVEVVAR